MLGRVALAASHSSPAPARPRREPPLPPGRAGRPENRLGPAQRAQWAQKGGTGMVRWSVPGPPIPQRSQVTPRRSFLRRSSPREGRAAVGGFELVAGLTTPPALSPRPKPFDARGLERPTVPPPLGLVPASSRHPGGLHVDHILLSGPTTPFPSLSPPPGSREGSAMKRASWSPARAVARALPPAAGRPENRLVAAPVRGVAREMVAVVAIGWVGLAVAIR